MKRVKLPITNNNMKIGEIEMDSNIDEILFVIQDEIDKKEIHKSKGKAKCYIVTKDIYMFIDKFKGGE